MTAEEKVEAVKAKIIEHWDKATHSEANKSLRIINDIDAIVNGE